MTFCRPVSAVVLGDDRDVHFRATVEWLVDHTACRFFGDAAAVIAAAADGAAVDDEIEPVLVALLQSRPGQFTEVELMAIRRRWPLARLVAVAGSWCDGESRSGFAASGVYRVAWHAAVERFAAEIGDASAGWLGANRAIGRGNRRATRRGLFDVAATATIDERLLANSTPEAARPSVVAVAARRASLAEPWIEALAAAGHAAVFWPLDGGVLVRGIDAVVWDTFGCEQRLEAFRDALPGDALRAVSGTMPIVAIAEFPRPQDAARLATLGVARVLGKPLLIADLLACLDALLTMRLGARTSLPGAVA